MYETITKTEQTWASTLMTAAEVARRFGPEGGVQLVLPRRPGLVLRAELIAQENGVDIQVLKLTEGSVHLRFVAREAEHLAESSDVATTFLPARLFGRLGAWLRVRVQAWYVARRTIVTPVPQAAGDSPIVALASDGSEPGNADLA